MLKVDRQIKQLLGQSDVDQSDSNSSEDEDWELPTPDYVFPERARLVENFYGPEAENFDEDKLLARRIQVTKDMVALSQLCEPTRRGKRINWDVDDDDETEKSEEPSPAKGESLEFSYMHDLGIQNGYIRTGEAFVFLRIPEDPTIVQYYVCPKSRCASRR